MTTNIRRQRPLKCRFCWVCFKYEATLVDHIKRSHKEALNFMLYQRYVQAISNGFISGSKSYRQIIEKNIKATSQIQAAKVAQAINLAKLTQQLAATPMKRPFSVIKHASAINN